VRDVSEPGLIGDAEERLIADLYGPLRRFAGVVGSFEMDPDDLVQEAIVRVLRTKRLADLENPSAYLRRVVVNLASSAWRSRGRERQALARLSRTDQAVTEPVYPSDVGDLLHLKPQARAVLFLHDVEGFDFSEVAAMLSTSEGAVRMLASRSRRRLRRLLAEEATR